MSQIRIDGEKLRNEFKARGIKPSHVSRKIGFVENYFSKAMSRGQCSEIAAKSLMVYYGIPQSAYEVVEDLPAVPVQPEQTELPTAQNEPETFQIVAPAVDYEAFRGAVKEAILDAMWQALNDTGMRNAISSLLMNAHKSALQLNLKERLEQSKRGV